MRGQVKGQQVNVGAINVLLAAAASPSLMVSRSRVSAGVGGNRCASPPAVPAGRQKSRDATIASPAAVGSADTAEMVQSAAAAIVSRVSAAHGGSEGVSRVQIVQLRRC